jgi:hypothetical protein
MRGGFIHNEIIIAALATAFESRSWSTDFETPVRLADGRGFVDLTAERDGHCIAVEAELSPTRIARDLEKAEALRANELWIVTPNARVRSAVRRSLFCADSPGQRARVFVLTQGQALSRVMKSLPLFAAAVSLRQTSKERNLTWKSNGRTSQRRGCCWSRSSSAFATAES